MRDGEYGVVWISRVTRSNIRSERLPYLSTIERLSLILVVGRKVGIKRSLTKRGRCMLSRETYSQPKVNARAG